MLGRRQVVSYGKGSGFRLRGMVTLCSLVLRYERERGRPALRAADAADRRVGSVSIGGRTIVGSVPLALERSSGLVLPLASGAVDVSLGASDSLRSAHHSDRVTPVIHPPQTAVLKIGRQVVASGPVLVETAVLSTPLAGVVAFPLARAAGGHETHTHAWDEDVETITRDIATVVDDLVEEGADLVGLGSGETDDVASAFVLAFGGAGHGSE